MVRSGMLFSHIAQVWVVLVVCVGKLCCIFRSHKMDGADSGDRPTVELFVKVRLFKTLER